MLFAAHIYNIYAVCLFNVYCPCLHSSLTSYTKHNPFIRIVDVCGLQPLIHWYGIFCYFVIASNRNRCNAPKLKTMAANCVCVCVQCAMHVTCIYGRILHSPFERCLLSILWVHNFIRICVMFPTNISLNTIEFNLSQTHTHRITNE